MSEPISDLKELQDLFEQFPEAKLTVRDRIPANMMLFYTIMNVQKVVKDIKYSAEEIREAMFSLVAMIPDELRDQKFTDEINACTYQIYVDVRPEFCGVKATVEHCQKYGIQTTQIIQQVDYFGLYHAVHNLLQRANISFRQQPKEILTGNPALETEEIEETDLG